MAVSILDSDSIIKNAGRAPAFVRGSVACSFRQYVLELGVHAAQGAFGTGPVDAAIGDGNAILQFVQILRTRLVAPVQVTFDHQADDRLVALDDLVGDVFHDQRLQGRVLVGVG